MNENATNNSSQSPKHRPSSRWIWGALVCSLALNFLVIGAVGGHLWAHRHDDDPRKFGKRGESRSFFRKLPPERKEIIKSTLREYRERTRPLWQKVKQARRQTGQILEAVPFDEEKFLASLTLLNKLELEARQASQPMMVQLINQLEPNERKYFLRFFNHRFAGSPRNRKKRNGPPGH